MGIRVNIDFDIDAIFNNEEFAEQLGEVIRDAVLSEFRNQVREETVRIYQEHRLDVAESVLKAYREQHADFVAKVSK